MVLIPSSASIQVLRHLVDTACSEPNGIPGAAVVVVNKDGKELFAHAAGKRGLGSPEPMGVDSIFWIASCTKLITAIAVMQLVERGNLVLDDAVALEKILPELAAVKVLRDDNTLEDKNKSITLRMLMTHTAGFGYTFYSQKLASYSRPVGYDEFSGHLSDILQPLIAQPGEEFNYGINLDWAGVAVERVTNMSLNDYMRRNIFEPLGLKHISMFPTTQMKDKLAYMHQRAADGKLYIRDHILRWPLTASAEERNSCLNSGGAGCFANPQEYCQILATLLNNGVSPTTNATILQQSTVDEMFTNQIPQYPNFARKHIETGKPELANSVDEFFPQPEDQAQGWGLSFMTTPHPAPTGRGANAVHWAGLPNLWWWCDREKGVAGMICTQIVPSGDLRVDALVGTVESTVYGQFA